MSQIQRKFIADNAVNGAKMRLDNNEMLRARNAANSADVPLLKLTAADIFEIQRQPRAEAAIPMPSDAKDYVTVEFVQNYIEQKLDPKEAADLLADANIPLTGATPLTVDGVEVTDSMRVALIGQTDPVENGPYIAEVDGGSYTLTRAPDFNESDEVTKGAYFPIVGGTEYAGYEVILTTEDPIVLDTTPLTFVAYPSTLALVGGDMIAKTGNIFSVDLAPLSGLESTNPGNVNGQLRVKTDTAALEKDQTTRRDPVSGAVVAKKQRKFAATLTPTDITNQYLDLPDVAEQDSVRLAVAGAGDQFEGDDFTVNYTGGTGSKTRVTFAGGLATAGVSALVSGDKVTIYYRSFV